MMVTYKNAPQNSDSLDFYKISEPIKVVAHTSSSTSSVEGDITKILLPQSNMPITIINPSKNEH